MPYLDGGPGGLEVEGMFAQNVLQTQQVHVRSQRHLAHTVRVEVELVFDYLSKMLQVEFIFLKLLVLTSQILFKSFYNNVWNAAKISLSYFEIICEMLQKSIEFYTLY